jgi:homoserine O-acetyltransferase
MADAIVATSAKAAQAARCPAPLPLDCGRSLDNVEIAYEAYGTLNAGARQCILVCHALTGDQHVASPHPITGKPGWWARMVGPGLPIDTDRFYVICANVLGSCMGSTGPASLARRWRSPGHALSGHHHPRHGARAGDAARPCWGSSGSRRSSAARWAGCRR